jgi:hypothetical protein
MWLALVAACNEYAFPAPGNDGSLMQPDDTGAPVSNAPVANAGLDQSYDPRSLILLDGSASRDPSGGAIVGYQWSLVSAPGGSAASLSDPADVRPSVFLDLVGTYVFELTVLNESGYWDPTPDRVQAIALPSEGLYVEVTWDQPSDLDLHLLEDGGPPFTVSDCTWCNPRPSWGANGPLNDPVLEVSTELGYGPEAASIDEPEIGTTYTVAVHYYGEDGEPACQAECPKSVAVVRVYVDGVETGTLARQLDARGDLWTAGIVVWPGDLSTVDAVVPLAGTGCTF